MNEYRASWNNSELTAICEAESAEEVYGMCGEFWFEQGGRGNMPCPDSVEPVK